MSRDLYGPIMRRARDQRIKRLRDERRWAREDGDRRLAAALTICIDDLERHRA